MADDTTDHALKGFNRPFEYVKHIGKSALRTAVTGGLIVGAVAMLLSPISIIGGLLAAITGGAIGTGTMGAVGLAGLKFGAMIGAAVGGLKGLAGAEEAVDEAQARHIASHERQEMRAQQQEILAQRQQMQQIAMARQAQAMGLTPNLPTHGRDAGGPQIG